MFEHNPVISRKHEEAEYSGDSKENPKKITQKPWNPHSALRECTFAALERSDIEECLIGALGVHIGIIAGAVGGKYPGIGSTISEPRFRCFVEVR